MIIIIIIVIGSSYSSLPIKGSFDSGLRLIARSKIILTSILIY